MLWHALIGDIKSPKLYSVNNGDLVYCGVCEVYFPLLTGLLISFTGNGVKAQHVLWLLNKRQSNLYKR